MGVQRDRPRTTGRVLHSLADHVPLEPQTRSLRGDPHARFPPIAAAGMALTGFASIGLGAGLFTADAPLLVLAAAFIPAVISMIVVAAQATRAASVRERVNRGVEALARTR